MGTLTNLQLRILEKAHIECDDITALAGDLVENGLIPTLRARLEAHVEGCQCCQEMLESYRWVIALAQELKPAPMPKQVKNRLHEKLNARLGLNLPLSE